MTMKIPDLKSNLIDRKAAYQAQECADVTSLVDRI
jgi:hypothetical protein